MKTSRIIQFVIAAMLCSVGCGLLLKNATYFAVICFWIGSLALYRRSDFPLSEREIRQGLGISAILVVLIVLGNHFIPNFAVDQFIHHPLCVVTLWVILMAILSWRWIRERGQPSPNRAMQRTLRGRC